MHVAKFCAVVNFRARAGRLQGFSTMDSKVNGFDTRHSKYCPMTRHVSVKVLQWQRKASFLTASFDLKRWKSSERRHGLGCGVEGAGSDPDPGRVSLGVSAMPASKEFSLKKGDSYKLQRVYYQLGLAAISGESGL